MLRVSEVAIATHAPLLVPEVAVCPRRSCISRRGWGGPGRASLHCVPLRTLPASATSSLRDNLHPPGPVPLRMPEDGHAFRGHPTPISQPLSGTGKHY